MWQVRVTVATGEKDLFLAELYDEPIEGVTENESEEALVDLTIFFTDAPAAECAAKRWAALGATLEASEDVDWVAVSREAWEPLRIGERLFLVPDWRDDPTPPGLIRIPARAGRACGSGAHPCTQLCLAALDANVVPGISVLDVGAGSGLLSVAAVRLGAGLVIACDNDPEAIEAATENMATDGIRAPLFVGSADAIRDRSVPLLVANISAVVDAVLAPEWRRILQPGGKAILSGFEYHEAEPVRTALRRQGFTIEAETEVSGWMCLVARQIHNPPGAP